MNQHAPAFDRTKHGEKARKYHRITFPNPTQRNLPNGFCGYCMKGPFERCVPLYPVEKCSFYQRRDV